MTKEDEGKFEEPKAYSMSKYRLGYSSLVIIIFIGLAIFDNKPTPPICYGLIGIFAIYLFFPFTYRLIVSNEAISSVSIFGAKTLEWNEIAEVRMKDENLFLDNRDGDVTVVVKQQIESYQEVIKFIQTRIPNQWKLVDIQSFHQNYFEQIFITALGLIIFSMALWKLIQEGISKDSIFILLILLAISLFLVIPNFFHVRKLTLDGDILTVAYIVRKRQIHVDNVLSVILEQEYGKNVVNYPVTIIVRNGNNITVKKVKEGNPILVNAIETWIKKYKRIENE